AARGALDGDRGRSRLGELDAALHRARLARADRPAVRALVLALLSLATAGCYRHHLRHADEDAGSTRCGSGRCALVASDRALIVRAGPLVGAVEGDASGLTGAPEVDGIRFDLDPCAASGRAPCPQRIVVEG